MPPKKSQEKKTDAAPKPKPAKETPAPNGSAEPAPAAAAAAAAAHAGKPDQDAYKAEQEQLRGEIDALQARLVCPSSQISRLTPMLTPARSHRQQSRTRSLSQTRMALQPRGVLLYDSSPPGLQSGSGVQLSVRNRTVFARPRATAKLPARKSSTSSTL